MNSPAADVATLLQTNGFGTLGVDLFGGEWGNPDAQILVVDAGMKGAVLPGCYEEPLIQVLYRGLKNQGAVPVYGVLREVHEFLLTRTDLTVSGTLYSQFVPESGIIPVMRDDNNRFVYSSNFSCIRNTT